MYSCPVPESLVSGIIPTYCEKAVIGNVEGNVKDVSPEKSSNSEAIKTMSAQWPGAICSALMDKNAVDDFVEHAVKSVDEV